MVWNEQVILKYHNEHKYYDTSHNKDISILDAPKLWRDKNDQPFLYIPTLRLAGYYHNIISFLNKHKNENTALYQNGKTFLNFIMEKYGYYHPLMNTKYNEHYNAALTEQFFIESQNTHNYVPRTHPAGTFTKRAI